MSSVQVADAASVRALYEKHGQSQVFQFADALSEAELAALAAQATTFRVEDVHDNFQSVQHGDGDDDKAADVILPFTQRVNLYTAQTSNPDADAGKEREARLELRRGGLGLIAEGGAAVVLMAGGQGTRLGSSAPKGCYDIGLPSHKSLFQVQAERITRLRTLAARHSGKDEAAVHIPWYIMTSIHTHAPTVAFFNEKKNFGLPADDVKFFQQGMLPCLTNDGKVILERKDHIAVAPDGNGGIYKALRDSGNLADMDKRGVQYVHVYGVDNALVKVAEPTALGYAKANNVKCLNKVVMKREPHEKVGVMCLRNGLPSVVEYSEISKDMAEERDDDGVLKFGDGNIANHLFHISMLHGACKDKLAFHVARKKIAYANEKGETVKPDAPNGIKLETFVFDVFMRDPAMVSFVVPREEEFTAVKNAPAEGVKDSPVTARAALLAYQAGIAGACAKLHGLEEKLPGEDDAPLEISPLVCYDADDMHTSEDLKQWLQSK